MAQIHDLEKQTITIQDLFEEKFALDDLFSNRHIKKPLKLLVHLAKICNVWNTPPEDIKLAIKMIKEKIPLLYKENRVSDEDLMFLAFSKYDFAKALIQEKVISPNLFCTEAIMEYDSFMCDRIGVPLLHCFTTNKVLRELLSLGADLYIKSKDKGYIEITNEQGKKVKRNTHVNEYTPISYEGLTLFEIAVKKKQKGLIKTLNGILPKESLDDLNQVRLNELKAEKNTKKQYKILVEAAREGNALVLDEISKDIEKYKDTLLFNGGNAIKKDILHYSLEFGQKDYVKTLLSFDLFPKNNPDCYTTFGLEKKQAQSALLAFNEGFYNENLLLDALNQKWGLDNSKAYAYIASVFHEEGIKVPLESLFNRGIHQLLELDFDSFKDEIKPLIKKHGYIFNIGEVRAYQDGSATHDIKNQVSNFPFTYSTPRVNVSQDKIKFVFKLLKGMKNNNMPLSDEYLDNFIESINKSPTKQMMIYLKIGINIFPEKERDFINKIQDEKVRANFEKKLFDIVIEEDEVYKPTRKMKI